MHGQNEADVPASTVMPSGVLQGWLRIRADKMLPVPFYLDAVILPVSIANLLMRSKRRGIAFAARGLDQVEMPEAVLAAHQHRPAAYRTVQPDMSGNIVPADA